MLIGRDDEIKTLKNALNSYDSSFISVYGRRRVGKTFLIKEFFNNRFTFYHSGLANGKFRQQLFAFDISLKNYGFDSKKRSQNWLEAFDRLKTVIEKSTEQKKIIFIDELSWMDTPKSDLMIALENFWNVFASSRKDIVLIICSSATSWMLSKVIHNKGGLYNRLTNKIHIKPFTLKECEEYAKKSNLFLEREQILQLYMIFGGVTFYWTLIEQGKSVAQNIDSIFFSENAKLKDEYKYLYASIFKNSESYMKIVEALGTKKIGLSRTEIIKYTGINSSGELSNKLEELESCGFIRKYNSFETKSKNALYQLVDHLTLFHFSFLEKETFDEHRWSNIVNTPLINTWLGLSFEKVCLDHVKQIKNKLGISGVSSKISSWSCKENLEKGIQGSQVDLLITRKDQVINLCEVKYSISNYIVNKKFIDDINRKISDLRISTGTKYAIFPTLITTHNVAENQYANYIQNVVTLDDLFKD